ncbi:hypothetical protein M0811_11053 [Anaeramoeba ignava]|uniref:Uncharacterized protein n=1 Tax=Anaeramoeba ignava TaxID=1746090 RepID=A0A9Q0LCK3_ANAIG|nr:hypothetical protein M0811_11053 [Anaeramoeba ignava]
MIQILGIFQTPIELNGRYSLSYNSESVCLSTKEKKLKLTTGNLTGINYEISIFASADPNCESNDYS